MNMALDRESNTAASQCSGDNRFGIVEYELALRFDLQLLTVLLKLPCVQTSRGGHSKTDAIALREIERVWGVPCRSG